MARSGQFTRSLSPFGAGRLNLVDAYRIEVPEETTAPPTPNAPPPRPAGGSPQTVPNPKPPIVGKTPVPRTAARRTPARRPVARRVATRPVATARKMPAAPTGTGRMNRGAVGIR